MTKYKSKSIEFKKIIDSSKTQIKNSLYGLKKLGFEPKEENCSIEQKMICNLDFLTNEGKIIWSRDTQYVFKGVVIENFSFSNHKILIHKKHIDDFDISDQIISISFMQGITTFKKVTYLLNHSSNKTCLNKLIKTITNQLLQQKN